MTLLFLFRHLVQHLHIAPTCNAALQRNERAMRVDSKRLGVFLERFTLRIRAADTHSHLHQHTLAALVALGKEGGREKGE